MKLYEAFEKVGKVFRELDPDHELSQEIEAEIDKLSEAKSTIGALMSLGSIGLMMVKSLKGKIAK